MRFPRRLVEASVNLYHSGLTLRSARKSVSKIYEILVKADSTVYRWSKRFAKQTSSVISGLADLLHCDETLLKTYKKRRFFYFWAVKCPRTKCIVAWHLSEHRTLSDAKRLLWEARRRFPIGYMPKAIRTDGFPGYRLAINKVFDHEVKHDKFLSFKNHSNNEIENFFRCKRRFPKFRDINSARKYMGHWVHEYNAEKLNFWTRFIIRLCKVIPIRSLFAFKYFPMRINCMPAQSQSLLNEIEGIKTRLIAIEMRILKTEKAGSGDKKAIREALKDYKRRKTVRF